MDPSHTHMVLHTSKLAQSFMKNQQSHQNQQLYLEQK